MSSTVSPPPPKRPPGKSRFLIISVLLHVLLGVGATYLIVQSFKEKRVVTFKGAPAPIQKEVEHKIDVSKKQRTMTAPAMTKRIATTALSKVALPEMPVNASPDTPEMMTGQPGALSTMGSGAGGSSTSTINFFGLKAKANTILFLLDSSHSNVTENRSPEIYRELEKAVYEVLDGLKPEMRFGIILYARKLWVFKDKPVFATPEMVAAAKNFIKDNSVATAEEMKGRDRAKVIRAHITTRADLAFPKAFELNPDVIYFVSDGAQTPAPGFRGTHADLNRALLETLRTLQSGRTEKVKINCLTYNISKSGKKGRKAGKMEDIEWLKEVARTNGGAYKLVE